MENGKGGKMKQKQKMAIGVAHKGFKFEDDKKKNNEKSFMHVKVGKKGPSNV